MPVVDDPVFQAMIDAMLSHGFERADLNRFEMSELTMLAYAPSGSVLGIPVRVKDNIAEGYIALRTIYDEDE